MISVIIPAYNHASTLPKCLDSVLAQRGVGIEIIVVDDGSTDDTTAVLGRYRLDARITILHQGNRGSNPARNRGFEASKGERVIFLDADAVLTPDTLAALSNALDLHPEAAYAYCDFRFGWKRFKTGPFDPERLKRRNTIHTAALLRREAFPGFDETIHRFQDWDVWLTMLAKGHMGVHVPGIVMTMRVARKGISSWMPRSWYRAPWRWMPGIRDRVERYERARDIIWKKHGLL